MISEWTPPTPPVIPSEYCGKWIVWNDDQTAIAASGETFHAVVEAAARLGLEQPVYMPVPDGFIGLQLAS